MVRLRLLLVFLLVFSTASASPQQDFIEKVGPAAKAIVGPTCGFPSVAIGQCAKESGWGTSKLFQHNNPLGRKCGKLPCVWVLTPEYRAGIRVMEWHEFQVYASLEEALIDYCEKLNKPWYKRDFSSPKSFIYSIQKPYATDPK